MGAEHKKLGVPGEEELGGRGVSYCATCDAAFFKDRATIIVGGGDSAMEEAIFLAKFSSKVVIVHRRDEFRASKIMLERAREHGQHRVPDPVRGRGVPRRRGRQGARPRAAAQRRDGREQELPMDGAFIAIGHEPQSEIVRGLVDIDDDGYVTIEGQLHAHQRAGHLRRRRPRRPHLPPGHHRRRLRLPGRAGRRVVPARQPRRADARGARGRRATSPRTSGPPSSAGASAGSADASACSPRRALRAPDWGARPRRRTSACGRVRLRRVHALRARARA